ncbi:MAG: DUF309 domain-containing protein [Nitrosopumilaceae archaeon]|nr:DUF309 domain-containing protein [Nitrosopumilaceae archaeon]NIU00106.1 DUF309 domain-containing protein [Nitrosopumilaceae archaeon]NIU86496.1 DUF309 domain-containing protein [Nitrosopumilaceae archaeon]NIV65731.1 DUF309 domain-containing protein [Nitrosopumilaceae archaeon]NIX60708.1 DUF309 domain-containing protein [Nitrosopumilaceae archaeon]
MKFVSNLIVERFMVHLQNDGYLPSDANSLLQKARDLAGQISVTIRDSRVSSKYLEFDVSIQKDELEPLLSRLKSLGKIDHAKEVIEEEKEKKKAIDEGVFFFNNERFWECHEVLEGVWKKCYEGEKDVVQSIILVAAAFVHFQKAENNICISILQRAIEKLGNTSGMYHDIDLDKLRSKVSKIIETEEITIFEI